MTISGVKDPIITNSKGEYISDKVPAGQVAVQLKEGYATRTIIIQTLVAKDVVTKDIGLINVVLILNYIC